MVFRIDVLTLLAFIGTFQGLAFALIFWIKNNNTSNKIFSFLMLATSIRIAKNIFVHLQFLNKELYTTTELWHFVVYAGISHQFAIGPLFLFYFRSKMNQKFKWKKRYYLHFLPYAICMGLSPFISWEFWKYGGLSFSYISILVYFLLSIKCYYDRRGQIDQGTKKWLGSLLVFTGILLLGYSPALFHYIGYIGGAVLYTIGIVITSYFMLTNSNKISFFRSKYETSSLSNEEKKRVRDAIEEMMQVDKTYLNPELTLQQIADLIVSKPYHVSRTVNQEFNMSFTDYINSYRLKEAVNRLKDPKYDHLKISALAYDCGFNSVPTFNTLFKRKHKITPTEFRSRR